jgi:hypothetical protein
MIGQSPIFCNLMEQNISNIEIGVAQRQFRGYSLTQFRFSERFVSLPPGFDAMQHFLAAAAGGCSYSILLTFRRPRP